MPPQVWRLPQTPFLESDPTPVTTEPLTNADNDYIDGFVPVGTATIIPYALDGRFKWEKKHNRPLVQVDLDPNLKEKDLNFEVIIYQGISPGYENSPQRFVFIGESVQVSVGFHNTYMRYQDLVDRLGPNQATFYKKDQERFGATPPQLPFPVWDMSGKAPNIGLKSQSFEAFLDSPSKGWVLKDDRDERDAQMFAFTCSWASAAMFPPKEPFSTVMRFFDKPIASGVKLHFRIDDALADQGNVTFNNFGALVEKARLKAITLISDYTVTTFSISPSSQGFETNKILLGSHPMGFYEIWANESSRDALKAAGVILPPCQFARRPQDWDVDFGQNSEEVELKYSGGMFPLSFDRTTPNFETETPIRALKLAAARNKKREPDQNTVMGNNAAHSIALKVWSSVGPQDKIEWLHRSAFSYGGLRHLGPKSSQTINNLVLGTGPTNTVMLRTEQFVKRYCQKQKTAVTVKTKVQWHQPIDERLKYCSWLAPLIEYTITATHPTNTKPIDRTIYFETQARVTPLRFDFELGRKVEAVWFGWNDDATDEEYDKEDNQGAGAPP